MITLHHDDNPMPALKRAAKKGYIVYDADYPGGQWYGNFVRPLGYHPELYLLTHKEFEKFEDWVCNDGPKPKLAEKMVGDILSLDCYVIADESGFCTES